MIRRSTIALLSVLAIAAARAPAANETPVLTESNVITGTMTMQFGVTTSSGKPATAPSTQPTTFASTQPVLVDTCNFDFDVARTTQFSGSIVRWPDRFAFAVDIAVLNPKNLMQKKTVGRWTGDVPYGSGGYGLAAGRILHRPMRISIDAIGKAPASADPFAGKLRLWDESNETPGQRHYQRFIGGQLVSLDCDHVRTLGFQSVELAKGPAAIYPRTSVTGRLDYDALTHAIIVDSVSLASQVEGKRQIDRLNGTIRWAADIKPLGTSVGTYAVNLMVANAATTRPTTVPTQSSAALPTTMPDFFSLDPAAPGLTGTVRCYAYADASLMPPIVCRRLVFQIHANQLGKPQILNVFKLALLGMMPGMEMIAPQQ